MAHVVIQKYIASTSGKRLVNSLLVHLIHHPSDECKPLDNLLEVLALVVNQHEDPRLQLDLEVWVLRVEAANKLPEHLKASTLRH